MNTSGGRRRNYTSAEDTVVRRFYAGEIGRAEVIRLTGRSLDSLWRRGRLFGLTWQKPKLTWEWLDTGCDPEHDLAALSVEAHDLPTIELGNSKHLQPGQLVLAL